MQLAVQLALNLGRGERLALRFRCRLLCRGRLQSQSCFLLFSDGFLLDFRRRKERGQKRDFTKPAAQPSVAQGERTIAQNFSVFENGCLPTLERVMSCTRDRVIDCMIWVQALKRLTVPKVPSAGMNRKSRRGFRHNTSYAKICEKQDKYASSKRFEVCHQTLLRTDQHDST